jgi:hypothetical protein
MAEIRCPMCSKPNLEDAETCSFCGARLKPLMVGSPPDETAGGVPPAGGQDEPVPDWLARIRSKAEADREPDEQGEPDGGQGEGGGSPDWLGRLRQAEPLQEEGPPEGHIPDWLDEVAERADEPVEAEPPSRKASPDRPETGWLDRLRAESVSGAGEANSEESPSEKVSPADGELFEPAADDALGWLGELEEAEPEGPATGSAAEGVSPWAEFETPPESEDEPGSQAQLEASEDWLRELGAGEPGGLPDWISELSEPGSAVPEDEAELPGFEAASDEESDDLPDFGPPLGEGAAGLPDLAGEPTGNESIQVPESGLSPSPMGEEPEAGGGFDWGEVEFDWDAEETPAVPEVEPEVPEPGDAGLPHVPALIMGEPGEEASGDVQDFDLSTVELPDWLSEVRADSGDAEGGRGDLAPATIPTWLEAMRPVETFRPVVDVEPEEEQAVESVGPLAGLRGVLLAEPVVAKPRTATSSGARLEVTERQYAQAELLQRIVEQEEQEVPAAVSGRRTWPLARWLVSAVMLLAVLIPAVVGSPVFPIPQRVSRDLGPLVGIVNTLPTDRPVLMVFDFEPGYSGELDAVAEPLIENLLARGINIVTVSTRPTGPPLAVDLIDRIGAPFQVENGRNVLHLGYLSGGPSAVQLFSAAPREAILKGFQLPPEMAGQSAWASPLLSGVHSLSDFGMVAVVAAGTDTARTWAEQAHPWLGNTPLVMVLSQGAEPLIRPYFESLTPQVNGILSGLPTALAYEELNGRQGMAFSRWNGFGSGAFAAEGLMFAGIVYGLGIWFVRRRRA